MRLEALTTAAPVIQAHAYAAFLAIGLGGAQLALAKGTARHRAFGWAWVATMLFVAGSSMFIHSIRLWGPFSPIHLLSIFTLIVVPLAVAAAVRGRVDAHAKAMRAIYILALVVTGLFTFFPGRIMYSVAFGP